MFQLKDNGYETKIKKTNTNGNLQKTHTMYKNTKWFKVKRWKDLYYSNMY